MPPAGNFNARVMALLDNALKEKLARIELLVLDVDGVLTDNTVILGPDGFEMKKFNIADGFGIYLAMRHGLKVAFISGRYSVATEVRARELGVTDLYQQPKAKIIAYRELAKKYQLEDDQIAFVGNDLVDLEAMETAGLAIAVPDSPRSVIGISDYITRNKGGQGAVREIIDLILDARGIDEKKRLA